jgi:hypothetical protein
VIVEPKLMTHKRDLGLTLGTHPWVAAGAGFTTPCLLQRERRLLAHSRDGGRPSWRPVIGVVLPPLWHQGHMGQLEARQTVREIHGPAAKATGEGKTAVPINEAASLWLYTFRRPE